MQSGSKYFKFLEELDTVEFISLLERAELYILGRPSVINKRSLYGVEVVCADSHELALSAVILVQLVLHVHE